MTPIIMISDLPLNDGTNMTYREKNLATLHNIPLGTLVEVKYEDYGGQGSGFSSKIHARMYVVNHARDCDGTPLYILSRFRQREEGNPSTAQADFDLRSKGQTTSDNPSPEERIARAWAEESGFNEKSLTIIEETPQILSGEDTLTWGE